MKREVAVTTHRRSDEGFLLLSCPHPSLTRSIGWTFTCDSEVCTLSSVNTLKNAACSKVWAAVHCCLSLNDNAIPHPRALQCSLQRGQGEPSQRLLCRLSRTSCCTWMIHHSSVSQMGRTPPGIAEGLTNKILIAMILHLHVESKNTSQTNKPNKNKLIETGNKRMVARGEQV